MSTYKTGFDELDQIIAQKLIENADVTSQQLGNAVGLSSSAANERLRRLKNEGVIKKVVALIDSGFMDMSLGAFVFVTVDERKNHAKFLAAIAKNKSILECHHMTGEYSYILKVRCKNTKALETLITDFLKGECGASKTLTQVILSSHKEESLVVD